MKTTNQNKTFTISLPDEYLLELGKIVYTWSILENVLDMSLCRLSRIDYYDARSAILFTHMPFPMKTNILSSLCENLLPTNPFLAGYKRVLTSLNAAATARNTAMHASWGVDENTGEVKRAHVAARGKLVTKIYPVSLKDLAATRVAMEKAGHELLEMLLVRDADDSQ